MDDSTSEPQVPDTDTPSADAPVVGGAGAPSTGPAKKKMSPWVWVGIGAVILLILGGIYAASASSGSGGLFFLFGGQNVSVPSVVGQPQAEAETAITAAGLKVGQITQEATLAVAPGLVVSQSPSADTKVKEGSTVDISVAVIPQVAVPDVVGQTESAASATLAEEGLRIGTITYAFSSSAAAGSITAQTPAATTQVSVGSAVNVTVSKGVEQGQVPNVVGLSQSDAETTLEGAGFKVTITTATSTDVPAGDVMSQSPAAGTVIAAGSTVTIKVSTGAPAPPTTPTTPTTPTEPATPAPSKATVPNVVGMRALEAVRTLRQAELKFSIEFGPATENFLKVAAQDPKAGTEVDPGTIVTITIGLPSFSLEPTVTPLPAPSPGATSGAEATTSP